MNGTRVDSRALPNRPVVHIKDVQEMSRQAETSAISKSVLATLSSYEAPVIIALCALGKQTARSERGFEVLEVQNKGGCNHEWLG